jgi:signal transduction histidine kinase/CheY-like chemotaxis protein
LVAIVPHWCGKTAWPTNNKGGHAIFSLVRGNLFTRLLVLVAAATVPAILVLVYLQSGIQDDRARELTADARTEAQMVSSDMLSIVEAARQITLAIREFSSVAHLDPACRVPLTTLDRVLASYDLIAVLDEDGHVVCASVDEFPTTANDVLRQLNATALASNRFETGIYMPPGPGTGPLLMFSQPFIRADRKRGVINVGLSLKWLNEHFEAFERPADSVIVVADRNGTILAQVPEGASRVGTQLSPSALALIDAPHAGDAVLTGADGRERLVGYTPVDVPPLGLFASVGLYLPPLTAELNRNGLRAYGLIALGACLSFAIALLVGQRFVRRPTKALLQAARAWSRGDLGARVPVTPSDRSEFGRIAQAFNAMAAALGRQRDEREDLNNILEARVTERTADLLRSRDRLQVALGEQAKSEASLRQAQKLQAVGQLAGGIAHDFNNLLTAVIAALDLLRPRLPVDDARSSRLVDNALQAADRGGKLTAQLLAFSRRQRLLPVPTDLNNIVLGMLGLLTSTLGREIRVETALTRGLWQALVDPHQVESAILNLALNARDAMPKGGMLRISTANITLPEPNLATPLSAALGDFVVIRVSDTGTGMPADVLAQVFEPFFTTKQPGRGSGLGLSQVHGLAAQSGGDVRVESEPGLGTTVSLLLPRADTSAEHVVPTPGTPPGSQRRLRALVADDDGDVRRLTGEMLGELGHFPTLVADGHAALAALRTGQAFDLLLADYSMPGVNGLALIEHALDLQPGILCLLVSGHADVDVPRIAGGHPVLLKPFTLAALARALARLTSPAAGEVSENVAPH